MNQTTRETSLLEDFGDPLRRVERAIAQLRDGGGVLVVDDEDRENEGDMIFAAVTLSACEPLHEGFGSQIFADGFLQGYRLRSSPFVRASSSIVAVLAMSNSSAVGLIRPRSRSAQVETV